MKKTHAEVVSQGICDGFGKRWIHSAAVLVEEKVFAGPRHYPIMQKLYDKGHKAPDMKEGYVTNLGEFLSADEALKLALENGQLPATMSHITNLNSSDLWDGFAGYDYSRSRRHFPHEGHGMFH